MENKDINAVCPICSSKDIKKKYDGGYFCRNCGSDIVSCRQCGSFDLKKGADGLLFCRDCGAKVKVIAEPDSSSANDLGEKAQANFCLAKKHKAMPSKDGDRKVKSYAFVAILTIVAIVLTFVFVKGKSSLVNEWSFGANTFTFNEDGTFSSNVNTLEFEGTYTATEDKINLSYKFMGVMDKETELTYSISGSTLTLNGDVTLTGSGSMTVDYKSSSGGAGVLRYILIILEAIVAMVVFIIIAKKKDVSLGTDEKSPTCQLEQSVSIISNEFKVGDTIAFGKYSQGEKGEVAEIDWIILETDKNKVLVLSKFGLDAQQYNNESDNVVWGTCSLRTWLNETFYNMAFNEEEKAKIRPTTVSHNENKNYSTYSGNETKDNVFLLSIAETDCYDLDWKCTPTAYAIAQGAYINSQSVCWWWLRSPGENSKNAAGVGSNGLVRYRGNCVDCDDAVVRPAMWIELS